jgi:Transposase DDE domain
MPLTKTLIQLLSNHFPMHPSRHQTFVGMVIGVMSAGNVQHHSLARHVESANLESAIQRVERFFKDQDLPLKFYAQTLIALMNFSGKFKLRIDRTNWKIGDKDVNYLVLSWHISKEVSLPLLFIELDKAGNSNTEERQDLIQLFIEIFGEDRIAELVGDREFIGDQWLRFLHEKCIPFFIRVKKNTKVPWGKKGCCLEKFYIHLQAGEHRIVEKEMFGTTVYFAGIVTKNGDMVIVITNQNLSPKRILKIYKQRWSIETLFKNLKTAGFDWEQTHMKDPKRLTKLLIIMGLATLLVLLVGFQSSIPWKKTVNCPLHSRFRNGLLQFQYLISSSVSSAIMLLESLASSAFVLIQKSEG